MTDDHAAAFAELGAATLGESGGRPDGAAHPSRVARRARQCGPAFPVACSTADNLAIHVAVAEAPAGSVLVVSVGHEPRARLLGRGAHDGRGGARHRAAS